MKFSKRQRRVGSFLTQRGSGQHNGFTWVLHADVKAGDIYNYLFIRNDAGDGSGFGGGGVGGSEPSVLAPENRNRIVVSGYLDSSQGVPKPGQRLDPNAVYGALASSEAKIAVELSDGTAVTATMLPADEENLQHFVHVFSSGLKVRRIVAFGVSGNELDSIYMDG